MTWTTVDQSHVVRMAGSTCETQDAREVMIDSLPVLDAIQLQAEMHVHSVVERVEHLVTLCNGGKPRRP